MTAVVTTIWTALQLGTPMSGDWWFGIVWMIVFALLLAAVVFAVVRVVLVPLIEQTEAAAKEPRERRDDEALAVLRTRFARGEIDEEEFEHRLAVLERSSGDN